MNRDTIIGIVGCVVLVTAMVGVFAYERSNAQVPGTGPVVDARNATVAPVKGSVAVGASDVTIVNVTSTAAKNVTFHLTWTATAGKDTMKLTVAPPTGSGIAAGAVSDPSDTGDITVSVLVPAGASPAGGWKVTVEFTQAKPAPLPGGVPPPATPPNSTDASVAYTVATTLS